VESTPVTPKISTNILYSFLAEIFLFAFSFVLGVVTARYLGADGKGKFWLVFNVAGILALIFSVRFQRSVTYHLSKDKERLGEILLYGLLMGIGTTACIALLVTVFSGFFNDVLLKNVNIYWGSLVLVCSARYLWSFIIAITEGLLLFKAKLFFMGGTALLKVLEVIFALKVLHLGFECLILFMGLVELIVCETILIFIMLRAKNYHLKWARFVGMLKYSAKSYPGMVSEMVTLRIDTFFLNFFTDPAQVGIYTVAVSLASMLSYLPVAIRNVLMPFIASYADTQITSRLSRLLIVVMSVVAILIIPLVWVIVIPLYGAEFAYSRVLFVILLPGMIFWGIFTLLASDIEGRGFPLQISVVSMICAIATIALDLALIPIWGSTGAAVVSSITYALSMILAINLYRRLVGVRASSILIPKLADLRFFSEVTNYLVLRARRSVSNFRYRAIH
jgi:O-antigen/teichoic acid export membrane protein